MRISFPEHWLTGMIALTAVFFQEPAGGQNINGERITVGKESITIINFPDRVMNINFSDNEANDYYIPKRREEKSISIQFNKEKQAAPNTGLLVNEGGRSHMFRLIFDSAYNINDDTRPPLWYDHSDLKELRVFVRQLNERAKMDDVQRARVEEEDRQAAKAERQKQVEESRKREEVKEQSAAKVSKEKAENEARKQQAEIAEMARLKKEADEKEKQVKLAAQKETEARKAAEEKERKAAQEMAQHKASEEKKLKELKEKADAEALTKAQQQAEERQRLQEEKLAKQKAMEDEKRRKADEELARKEAERKAMIVRLAKLEADKKLREQEKAYSEVGLWQRYGSKGIDLYNFPREQVATVLSDFYVERDTLRNFQISDSLIHADVPGKLDFKSDPVLNGGVNIYLENIVFRDAHTFYKLRVENNTKEDFLMGRTYMYWYDANEKAKQIIKGSYLTYIGFFPLVRPQSVQHVVFVTRSPNMLNEESLVLFVDERRKDRGETAIVIPGATYNKELAKVQESINPGAGKMKTEQDGVKQKVKRK